MMIFLDPNGQEIQGRQSPDAPERPLGQAVYLPAGVPLWSRFISRKKVRHLTLHLHATALENMLRPALGSSAAQTAIRNPVEVTDAPAVDTLARLMLEELSETGRHPLYAENLARSIVTALLPLGGVAPAPAERGGLTGAQIRHIQRYIETHGPRRVAVSELAAAVGLSEGWFIHSFRETMGETPLQWQQRLRIDRAKRLLSDGSLDLSDIACQLGFSDQSHFTRVFRNQTGMPPAAWRRHHAWD
ncbi:helix-turn-helix transcriptional regulator [Thioclava sp. BHET1]|nr:helix-turn-helix transcriptional regulator [Thioclava sp. BHET1]